MPREPAFLPLSACLAWEPLAAELGVSEVARAAGGFLEAYEDARGRPAGLSAFWRRKRSGFIARHWAQSGAIWVPRGRYQGLPTRQMLALIMWAWHPDPAELRRALADWRR